MKKRLQITKSRNLLYLCVFLAYLALKLPFALTENWHVDQVVNGNLPHAMIHGLIIPWWLYQLPSYVHGSLFVVPFVWLGFLLFGEYNVVMTGLAVLISLGICMGWIHLALRYGSERLAWLLAAVFIVSPPFWNYMNSHLFAGHMESLLFSVVQIILALSMFEKGTTWRRVALLGLVSGLGTLFSFHNVFTLAFIVVFWVLREGLRRTLPRIWAYFAVIGLTLIPSVIYNIAYKLNFEYFTHRMISLEQAGGVIPWLHARFFEKIYTLFVVVIPNCINFNQSWRSHLYMLLVAAGWAVAVGILVQYFFRHKTMNFWEKVSSACRNKPLQVLAVLFTLGYVAIYTLGSMEIPEPEKPEFYRYLMPVFPMYYLSLAILFDRLGRAALPIALVVTIAVVHPAFFFNKDLKTRMEADEINLRKTLGYDNWKMHHSSVAFYLSSLSMADRPAAMRAVFANIKGPERLLAVFAAGNNFEYLFGHSKMMPEEIFDWLDAKEKMWLAMGAGKTMGEIHTHGGASRLTANEWLEICRNIFEPHPDYPGERIEEFFARGLGWGVLSAFNSPYGLNGFLECLQEARDGTGKTPVGWDSYEPESYLSNAKMLAAQLPEELLPSFVFGMGVMAGMENQSGLLAESILNMIIPPTADPHPTRLREGIGYGTGFYIYRYYAEISENMIQRSFKLKYLTAGGIQDHSETMRRGLDRFLEEWGLELSPVRPGSDDYRVIPVTTSPRSARPLQWRPQ